MTENRKRNETLTIRLTKAEKSAIRTKARKAKLNLTDYIIAASLQTEITVAEDVKPLIAELKRIGNNLNQIAVKVNSGAFHSADFQDVIDLQRMVYEEVYRIARES